MSTRLPMTTQFTTLLLGSLLMTVGCEAAPFDYYPTHETAVACEDVHKGADAGDFGGFNHRYTSSTAGTNPSTGPATGPAASAPSAPAMSIGR